MANGSSAAPSTWPGAGATRVASNATGGGGSTGSGAAARGTAGLGSGAACTAATAGSDGAAGTGIGTGPGTAATGVAGTAAARAGSKTSSTIASPSRIVRSRAPCRTATVATPAPPVTDNTLRVRPADAIGPACGARSMTVSPVRSVVNGPAACNTTRP